MPEIKIMDQAKVYLKENYYIQYIIEDYTRERGRIEGFLSYVLDVKHIHEEH